jgi:hypothetical protein
LQKQVTDAAQARPAIGDRCELSLLQLLLRSPELNRQEQWQFIRQNWLSSRIIKSFDDIVDHCC